MGKFIMLKSWFKISSGVLLLSLALFSYSSLSANTGSAMLLKKMAEAIKENASVELRFDMVATIDGTSKWMLSVEAGELTVFPNDTTQNDLVENPVGFLTSLSKPGSGYKFPDKPKDGPVWIIELTPVSKRTAYKNVLVGINKVTNLPVSIEYNGKDGSNYKVVITSFKNVSVKPLSEFAFPQSRMAGLTVTDLR